MRRVVSLALFLAAGCAPATTRVLDVPEEARAMLIVSGIPPEVQIRAYELPASASIPVGLAETNTDLLYVGYYRATLLELDIPAGPVPVVEDGRPLPPALEVQALTPDLRAPSQPRSDWPEALRSVEISGCADACDCAPGIVVLKTIGLGEPPAEGDRPPAARFALALDERRALVHLSGGHFFVVDEERAERVPIDIGGQDAHVALRRDDGSLWLGIDGGGVIQLDASFNVTSSTPPSSDELFPRVAGGSKSGELEVFALDFKQRLIRWRERSGWEDLRWESERPQSVLHFECDSTTQRSALWWQGPGRVQALHGEARVWHFDESAMPRLSSEVLSARAGCRAVFGHTDAFGSLLALLLVDLSQPLNRSFPIYRQQDERWVEWLNAPAPVRAMVDLGGYLLVSLDAGALALVAPGSADGSTRPAVCSQVLARATASTVLIRVGTRVLVAGFANCDGSRCVQTPPDVAWVELR